MLTKMVSLCAFVCGALALGPAMAATGQDAHADITAAAQRQSFLFERRFEQDGKTTRVFLFCIEDAESRWCEVIRLAGVQGTISHAMHLEGTRGAIDWSTETNKATRSTVLDSSAISGWGVPTFDLQFTGLAALEGIPVSAIDARHPDCTPEAARKWLESQGPESGGKAVRYEALAYRPLGTCSEYSGALAALTGVERSVNSINYLFPLGDPKEQQEIVELSLDQGRISSIEVRAQGILLRRGKYSYTGLDPVVSSTSAITTFDSDGAVSQRVTADLVRVGADHPLDERWNVDGWRPAGSSLAERQPDGSWTTTDAGVTGAFSLEETPSLMDSCMPGARLEVYARLMARQPSATPSTPAQP
jgi:hypothetical protein